VGREKNIRPNNELVIPAFAGMTFGVACCRTLIRCPSPKTKPPSFVKPNPRFGLFGSPDSKEGYLLG
jgi:hypothetical protein